MLTLHLTPSTRLTLTDQRLTAHLGERHIRLGKPPSTIVPMLMTLSDGVDLRRLQSIDGITAAATMHRLLLGLCRLGAVEARLSASGILLATLRPAPPAILGSPPASPVQLAPAALLRREGAALVLEGAVAGPRLILHDDTVPRLMADLLTPTRPEALPEAAPWLHLMAAIGALTTADQTPMLEFHDHLFHTRSRSGVVARPMGPTWRRRGEQGPPIRPRWPGEACALPEPAPGGAIAEALAERRSVRAWSPGALSREALSTLLHQAVRIQQQIEREPGDTVSMRPYPSGGARHPLEVYLAVQRVSGLAAGLYHYDARQHDLTAITTNEARIRPLLSRAGQSVPAVMLLITARFARTAARYEAIAYALILKEVGALMQTLYLSGGALGLGVCAMGAGADAAFYALTGLSAEEEGLVGEVSVGLSGGGIH